MTLRSSLAAGVLAIALLPLCARSESGHDAWLRYAPIRTPQQYRQVPSRIVLLASTPTDQAAALELQRGLTALITQHFLPEGPS